MPIPGGGGTAPAAPAPGVGGAGAMAGADVLSDAAQPTEEADVDGDAYDTPLSADDSSLPDASSDATESQWATFEEPDHGFDEQFPDKGAWSGDGDGEGWGNAAEGADGEDGGLFGAVWSIFNIFSDSE